MPQLSVEVFVDEMERLGLRLGVTRLADGKVRLNRWQASDGVVNAQRIDDLWATQIGDSVERIDELTEYLLRRTLTAGAAQCDVKRELASKVIDCF